MMMVIAPVRVPVAGGLKVTLMVQPALAGKPVPHTRTKALGCACGCSGTWLWTISADEHTCPGPEKPALCSRSWHWQARNRCGTLAASKSRSAAPFGLQGNFRSK